MPIHKKSGNFCILLLLSVLFGSGHDFKNNFFFFFSFCFSQSLLYMFKPNVIACFFGYFQQSFKNSLVLFSMSPYIHNNYIFIGNSNIKDLNFYMHMNHITNGCFYKMHIKHVFFASGK